MIPKNKPFRSKKYLAWVSQQPCAICKKPGPSDYAHQRILNGGSADMKPPDNEVLPCCFDCHRIGEHGGGVLTLWKTKRPEFFGPGKFESKQDLRDYIRVRCASYYYKWLKETH